MKSHKQITKDFNTREFDSPDEPFSGFIIDTELVLKLQTIRDLLKAPIIVVSGVRTRTHNEIVGGVYNSEHLFGRAADIYCAVSATRFLIVKYAMQVGFTRIGISRSFIHLDISQVKAQQVFWQY